MTNVRPDDKDTDQTDTQEYHPDLCDCEDCNPVILEDQISRPGEIIDIGDDSPHLFHARNYDPHHEDQDHYLYFDNPWDNPWDETTSDYNSQDNEDSQDSEDEEFPSIWHELVHDLMEVEQISIVRIY